MIRTALIAWVVASAPVSVLIGRFLRGTPPPVQSGRAPEERAASPLAAAGSR